MPPVSRHEKAVSFFDLDVAFLNFSEFRPFEQVRVVEVNWRVVSRQIVVARIDERSLIRRDVSEVLIPGEDTHNVFHTVSVTFGSSSETMPVSLLF